MKDKVELSGYTFCKIKPVYVFCVEFPTVPSHFLHIISGQKLVM